MKHRPPIDTGGARATGETDLQIARQVIGKSGGLPVLTPLLETGVGRPRSLPLKAFLVAAQLNALHRHHQGHLVEIARILNAMTPDQRASLGVSEWDSSAYDRVERLFVALWRVLEEGPVVDGVEVDAGWFANRIMAAAILGKSRNSSSVALDGTDIETWGALHGDCTTVEVDGEAAETQLMEDVPKKRKAARKARLLGVGSDGRKQYTVDPDARAGHRSATNSRPAGPYVGFELHLAVQTRDVRWTDGIERTSLGPEVAGVITTFSLVAAGTHRGRATVDELLDGDPIQGVVWDPGYSLCKPGTVHHRLAQAGIHQTFQAVTHQRGIKPFSGETLLIDGQLYSPLLPKELRDLPAPPRGASEEEKLAYEAKFNPRARWRLTRHAGPDRRRSDVVEVPVLFGAATQPVVPEDHAAVADGATGGDGSDVLLLGHSDRRARGAAMVAEHRVRDHGLAHQHGPTAGGRVRELRPQGRLCRSQPRVLPGHRAREDDRAPRVHARRFEPRPCPVLQGEARPGRHRPGCRETQAAAGSAALRQLG